MLETFRRCYGGTNQGSVSPYIEHAKAKGWISKDEDRVLSAGWQTAARFLKR